MKGGSKKFAVALAVFAASLAIAEVGLRWSTTPAFDGARELEHARLAVDSLEGARWNPRARNSGEPVKAGAEPAEKDRQSGLLLHPFYGFDTAGSDSITSREAASFAGANAKKSIDILILGGSVAGAFGNECANALEDALKELPIWKERGVRVYNSARGGFRQPQQLHQLEYLLAIGYKPDIVIELDGFNEVGIGVANARVGVHPIMPSIAHWRQVASAMPLGPRGLDAIVTVRLEQRTSQRILARAESLGLFHSAIATRFTQILLERSRARYSNASQAYEAELLRQEEQSLLVGPTFDGSDDDAIKLSSEIWYRSSLEMDAICRLWNIRYVHLLQPTLNDEGSKPRTENERKENVVPKSWVLGARVGYPMLRARGADLVARGVEFCDLSYLFVDVKQDLYYDGCHFVHAGQQILLGRVVEILGARPPEAFVPADKDH